MAISTPTAGDPCYDMEKEFVMEATMVTIAQNTQLNEENKVVIPDEIRETLGIKAGDSIVWSIDDAGAVHIRRAVSFEDLRGCLPALDRHVDDDFGNIIRESQEEWAAERMKRYGLS